MSDSHTNSGKRQIRRTSNIGAPPLYETENPKESQFPIQMPEIIADGRFEYSTHNPLIHAYVSAAAEAVLKGEDNCDSSVSSRRFAAEQITKDEASKNYNTLKNKRTRQRCKSGGISRRW